MPDGADPSSTSMVEIFGKDTIIDTAAFTRCSTISFKLLLAEDDSDYADTMLALTSDGVLSSNQNVA